MERGRETNEVNIKVMFKRGERENGKWGCRSQYPALRFILEYGSGELSNEVEVLWVSASNETERLTRLLLDLQALSPKGRKRAVNPSKKDMLHAPSVWQNKQFVVLQAEEEVTSCLRGSLPSRLSVRVLQLRINP